MCNLSNGQSFILSEFDVQHKKAFSDTSSVEFLELRLSDQDFFCIFAGPFFANGILYVLTPNDEWTSHYNLPFAASASGILFGTIFMFIEIRKAKMGLNFKKFLFLFSLLMVAIVNPAVCWTFFIIDHSSADAFSFNSYYDTWRFTYLLLVTFPVLILINIIVTMCGYKSTSRFNKDRWEQAIYGRGQLKVAGDDEEHLIEENSVGIAHLGGYVEPKPEYNPTVRKCTEKNL